MSKVTLLTPEIPSSTTKRAFKASYTKGGGRIFQPKLLGEKTIFWYCPDDLVVP